ncbi:MAG: mshA 2 [Acidimicrobiia bacterium]|nr:mshA 2 [Acidimicrobiia bacterium]
MRILIVAWRDLAHPQAGGSEKLVDACARGALALGHEVALIASDPIASRKYPVASSGSTFGQYLRAPRVARRDFADYDVLVDVSNGLPFFSPVWWRKPVVQIVHHVHTDQWPLRFPRPLSDIGALVERKVVPWIYRKHLYAAVSPSTQEELEHLGIPADSIRLLPNATDQPVIATEPAAKSAEPRFVIFGRLVPHKRVDLALRLWPKVRAVTGGQLVIAGDGPERQQLEAMATDGVEFVGRVDDSAKAELFASSWALVHPAMHEGWGIVVMEAAAYGTPAIGFDVPGVRDSIVDGETGVLVRDEDEFVERWLALAADVNERVRLGDHAAVRAATYGEEQTGARFVEICHEAINRAGALTFASP